VGGGEMNEIEYRAHKAVNFSSLAAFYNKGSYSPDHALMGVEFKSYFEYGKMFETLLQDSVKGTDHFNQRFFKCDISGKMPDDLIRWIDNKEDLSSKYIYTKKGDLSKTHRTRHAFLDVAVENPGKIPVDIQTYDLLNRHVGNMLKMEYLDANVRDILAKAQLQVPFIWKDDVDGIEKKGLADCIVDLGGEALCVDIKTTANFKQFQWMLRDKYFIQDIHYSTGITYKINACMQVVFFVASKEPPYLCQPFCVDYGGLDFRLQTVEEYHELCIAYKKWVDGGRWPKGWLPLNVVKKYPTT
jgi:hypothetical protein